MRGPFCNAGKCQLALTIILLGSLGQSVSARGLVKLGSGVPNSDIIPVEPSTPPDTFNWSLDSLRVLDFDYEDIPIVSRAGLLPALWHTKITGSAFAKQEYLSDSKESVNVYVIDSQVRQAADDIVTNIKLKPRMIKRLKSSKIRCALMENRCSESADLILSHIFWGEVVEEIDPREKEFIIKSPAELWHGTHVAGTIGAGHSPLGVSDQAHIISLPVNEIPAYRSLEGFNEVLSELLRLEPWNTIVNISMKFPVDGEMFVSIDKLTNRYNSILVLAAGNDSATLNSNRLYQEFPGEVTVGSFSPFGLRSDFSDYGKGLNILAPGEAILSRGPGLWKAKGENLIVWSGTSMAAPIVTGSLTDLRALLPKATNKDLIRILYRTAWDLGAKGFDQDTGHGLINSLKAAYVAKRIAQATDGSPEQIHKAVADSSSYETEQEHRRLLIEFEKSEEWTRDWEHLLYANNLLSDKIEQLNVVADAIEPRFESAAAGLRMMVANRSDALDIDDETLTSLAAKIIRSETMNIAVARMNDKPATKLNQMASLANAKLIFRIGELVQNKDWESIAPNCEAEKRCELFAEAWEEPLQRQILEITLKIRMMLADPLQMESLIQLFGEENSVTSVQAPAAL